MEVLGVVENMSYFIGDDGKEYDIFGRGGAQTMAQKLNHPFLGSVPINMALRKNGDSGDPSANFEEERAGWRATAAGAARDGGSVRGAGDAGADVSRRREADAEYFVIHSPA